MDAYYVRRVCLGKARPLQDQGPCLVSSKHRCETRRVHKQLATLASRMPLALTEKSQTFGHARYERRPTTLLRDLPSPLLEVERRLLSFALRLPAEIVGEAEEEGSAGAALG